MTAKRNIPFFNYSALFERQKTEIMSCVEDVLGRGAYILQRDLEEFEENIKELIGVKHVLGVADGTNALILSLRAAGVGHGDEVIMSSHTYIAIRLPLRILWEQRRCWWNAGWITWSIQKALSGLLQIKPGL